MADMSSEEEDAFGNTGEPNEIKKFIKMFQSF